MIYVFLADGFEEIEALTAVDVLRRAELDVCVAGVGGLQITGSHGISVRCDIEAQDASPENLEMLVLPGGMPGALNLEKSEIVRSFIEFAAENGRWIAAICAAPSILGHMGLLAGRKATCFPGFEEQLAGAQLSEEFVCVDGRYVTGKGMGVALEFSLKLTELLAGAARAQKIRASLQCRA